MATLYFSTDLCDPTLGPVRFQVEGTVPEPYRMRRGGARVLVMVGMPYPSTVIW